MSEKHPEIDSAMLEAYGKKVWGGDFVLSVTREWLKTCQTPMLVLPGVDAGHPNAIGKEIAKLAPKAEKLEPWKEPPELIPSAVQRVRKFLHSHTPG
jgi:hypothetical protein